MFKPEDLKRALENIEGGIATLNKAHLDQGTQLKEFNDRLSALESASKARAVSPAIPAVSLPGVTEDGKKFSFARAIVAISTKDWRNAGFEKEVFDNAEKRALSAGVDTAGGYLVPKQVVDEFIPMLRAKTVLVEMGAKVLTDLVGSPVEMNKQTGGASVSVIGEGEDSSESEFTMGQLIFNPRQLAARTRFSNRLLRQSAGMVESLVRDDLSKAMARKIDLLGLRGTGGKDPVGIFNTSGINTVAIGTNGGEITYDHLVDMVTKVDKSDALEGSLWWLFAPDMRGKLSKIKDGNGRPLFNSFDPGGMGGQPGPTILGYRWKTSSQLPVNLTKGTGTGLTEVSFGDFSQANIAFWGGMLLDASREADDAFKKNQTWVRIIQEFDFGVRQEKGICLCNDAKAA